MLDMKIRSEDARITRLIVYIIDTEIIESIIIEELDRNLLYYIYLLNGNGNGNGNGNDIIRYRSEMGKDIIFECVY